ncbi:MAG: hypothetical protein Q8Q07_08105 [Dehalococcoidales bacterium]|nr:hypothetical protein [Dehalococcoidales bacterium]
MRKRISYAFFTCTLAYVLAAIIIFILSVAQTGWERIDSDAGTFLISALTLALSEFSWWGDFYYLAILVPWLSSALMLILLVYLFKGAGPRRVLGGLSIGAYYLAMFLVFIINGLIGGWEDITYPLLMLWPLAGFGLGYLATFILEKMVMPQLTG